MAPSAQLQRAQAAVKAMKLIGFCQAKAKIVLKKLLKVYENNWEYIEAENYRLLADAILDDQESVAPEENETDAAAGDTPELSRKRLRRKQDDSGHLPLAIECGSFDGPFKRPKLLQSPENIPANFKGKMALSMEAECSNEVERSSFSPYPLIKNGPIGERAPQPSHVHEALCPNSDRMFPQVTRSNNSANVGQGKSSLLLAHERDEHKPRSTSGNLICYKKAKIEPETEVVEDIASMGFPVGCDASDALLPHHGCTSGTAASTSTGLTGTNMLATQSHENDARSLKVSAQKDATSEHSNGLERYSTNTDIASSNTGEVKLSLSYSSDCRDFNMPSLESVIKMVEDRCLKSYKVLQPDFSLMNLLKEVCQCAADLATESSNDAPEKAREVIPLLEPLQRSQFPSLSRRMTRGSSRGSLNFVASEISRENESSENADGSNNGVQENSANSSLSLAIIPQQEQAVSAPRPPHDENDIAKGEERVRISLINEITSEKFPAFFHYIPRNAVYQNAHVNFSLARIGDEDCCIGCFGDCLSAPIPCACTRETGGEFVYTMDGLLKKEFLDECISMIQYPDKHHHVYCIDCPIEKSKNEQRPDACKGHLVRKFIKECWCKCGCSKQCGNRVVQRGITRNLQVFFTPDGKGWALRTLEELPRGAFVCEYVGEILTNIELYDRTIQKTGSAKHTYPVLLDADWGSEAGLRDEEALCLDATFYGNVGRFVNHRCVDANLVEVPVEWETPDHHYYHLAFFTTRKVEALEELTWDYGIDFDDRSHPIKAFKCLCGSKFCRDRVRAKPRSRASGSK